MPLARVAVILVEPQSAGNVGMVCRAMANFGATDLRLVRPCPLDDPQARQFAVDAAPLLEQATHYASLAEALSDRVVSLAVSRRTGRLRPPPLALPSLGSFLARTEHPAPVGLVFGREDSGLTLSEATLCSASLSIPSVSSCASLNLAQAVMLCLYELARQPDPVHGATEPSSIPACHGQTEPLLSEMSQLLTRAALLNPARPESVMTPLRQLLRRAAPTPAEVNLLRGICRQLAEGLSNWPQRRRGMPRPEPDPGDVGAE